MLAVLCSERQLVHPGKKILQISFASFPHLYPNALIHISASTHY